MCLCHDAPMKNPVTSYFDGWAKRYDTDMLRFDYKEPQFIFETLYPLIQDFKTIDILDIGIGTGLASQPFKTLAKPVHITGIDASNAMLKLCKNKGFTDVLSICDIACDALPFHDKAFDIILMAGVVEYLQNPIDIFNDISRLLKPQGFTAISYEPRESQNNYKGLFLNGVLKDTGLQTTIQRLMPRRLFPKTYQKHLYSKDAVTIMLEQTGLTPINHKNFTAYGWSKQNLIPHELIIAIKKEHF